MWPCLRRFAVLKKKLYNFNDRTDSSQIHRDEREVYRLL